LQILPPEQFCGDFDRIFLPSKQTFLVLDELQQEARMYGSNMYGHNQQYVLATHMAAQMVQQHQQQAPVVQVSFRLLSGLYVWPC
jgi:hypothetical protein